MTRDEALQVLDLPANATDESIQARFRELALEFHSDTGGEDQAMARLLMAREIALRKPTSVALVPVDELQVMIEKAAEVGVKRYDAAITKNALIETLGRRRTSSLRSMKQLAGSLSFISGLFALFSSDLFSVLTELGAAVDAFRVPMVLMAAGTGSLYLLLARRIELAEERVRELGQALLDRSFYLELLQQILATQRLTTLWTKQQLISYIDAWPGPREQRPLVEQAVRFYGDVFGVYHPGALVTAARLPGVELAPLLITSGLERDVLDEVVTEENGILTTSYRIIHRAGAERAGA